MPDAMAQATLPETKHTPGPWSVSKGCDQYVCNEGNWIAATMGIRGEEGAANAALIARAPDLLAENERLREALRGLLDSCGARQRYHALDYAAAVEKAEAALSEQEGK